MTEFERQDPVRYLPCMHNFHQEQILLNVLPYHLMPPLYTQPVWPEKNRQMSIKVAQKWFHEKNDKFWHLYKNCLECGEIWAN